MSEQRREPAPTALTGRGALLFIVACGLLAEAIELLHVQAGGIAPPGWVMRGALFVAYALIGAGLLGVARLLGRGRALALAATGFALCLVLPWLNFTVLPRFGSARSLLGNAAALVLLGMLVPLLMRLPRTALAAVAGFALAVNLWPHRGPGDAAHPSQHARAGAPPFNVMVVLIDTLRAD